VSLVEIVEQLALQRTGRSRDNASRPATQTASTPARTREPGETVVG